MASSTPEDREKTYLSEAVSVLGTPCAADEVSEALPRMVLLAAFISAIENSSAHQQLKALVDLSNLKEQGLLPLSQPVTTSPGKGAGLSLLQLLVALEAVDVLHSQSIKSVFSTAVPVLVKLADRLLAANSLAAWEVRLFLAKHFVGELKQPLKIALPANALSGGQEDEGESSSVNLSAWNRSMIERYIDAVAAGADEPTILNYLKELLLQEKENRPDSETLCRLEVIRRLVQHAKARKFSPKPL